MSISETILAESGVDLYTLRPRVFEALEALAIGEGDNRLYRAADPGYPRNFTRDSLIAAALMGDEQAMRAQVRYSAQFQADCYEALTGKEPGKIHHEFHHELPEVFINGASSSYNACDTTALFLSSLAALADRGHKEFYKMHEPNIERAVEYIASHIGPDGLFFEDPSLCGAEKFGLKVTYWKDSILNHPDKTEPHYPIVYSLAHFQNADALIRIGKAGGNVSWLRQGKDMLQAGIDQLWRGDHFTTARDADGDIDAPSTDSLHALLFIPSEALPEGYTEAIQNYTTQLETPAGYRTAVPVHTSDDDYHTRFIWTHEQALLHAAAKRHGLNDITATCQRVLGFMGVENGIFPELIDPQTNYAPAGNLNQLWAASAYLYFANPQAALI